MIEASKIGGYYGDDFVEIIEDNKLNEKLIGIHLILLFNVRSILRCFIIFDAKLLPWSFIYISSHAFDSNVRFHQKRLIALFIYIGYTQLDDVET